MKKKDQKKILFCPLDWGLGHAARDVPLIRRLLDLDQEVVLAGDGPGMDLLCREFPELGTYAFRSLVRIRYSSSVPAWLKIALLSPLFLLGIACEHQQLGRAIRKIRPDLIISDNRYGLWNRRVNSILITHQISVRMPGGLRFLEFPVHLALRAFIKRFTRCWIPDYPGDTNLSGDLAHRYSPPGNSVYIGAISRFAVPGYKSGQSESRLSRPASAPPQAVAPHSAGAGISIRSVTARMTGPQFDTSVRSRYAPVNLVILVSGPEPQRSLLQKIVVRQVLTLESTCVILQGLPGKPRRTDLTSTATLYNHLPAAQLGNLLREAEYVICRSGYTSIMDLALLEKKAMIIPTPGQTEQEYLADYLERKGFFLACSQEDLDLESALRELDSFEPEFSLPEWDLLDREVRSLF